MARLSKRMGNYKKSFNRYGSDQPKYEAYLPSSDLYRCLNPICSYILGLWNGQRMLRVSNDSLECFAILESYCVAVVTILVVD